jgi:hypothetical protein
MNDKPTKRVKWNLRPGRTTSLHLPSGGSITFHAVDGAFDQLAADVPQDAVVTHRTATKEANAEEVQHQAANP